MDAVSPTSTGPERPRRPGPIFWLSTSVCVLAVLLHAWANERVLVSLSLQMDPAAGTERAPSPPIYRQMAYDGYLWVRHASRLGREGGWRLRFTDFDNAPKGREVHWNSAFAWYLRALGALRHRWAPSESLRTSIARMGIWANPILLVACLLASSWWAARRFGDVSGSLTAFGMILTPTFYEGFYPAYPDHHGLISAAIMGTVYGVLGAGVGWVGGTDAHGLLPADEAVARRSLVLSAVFGAAGFWFSAISMAIAMVGIGLGVLAAALFGTGSVPEGVRYCGHLWRWWGRVGSLATLGFYLLEYFPSWPVLRLEVNHPLYALAWWGGGEALAALTQWLVEGRRRGGAFPWARLVLSTLALLPIPILVWVLGEQVHAARGAFLTAVHRYISEFKPLLWRISNGTMTWTAAFGVFPVIVAMAVPLLFVKRVPFSVRAALTGLLGPVVFITAMQFYQIRWGTLGGGALIALAVVTLGYYWRLLGVNWEARLGRVALMALLALLTGRTTWEIVGPEFASAFRSRDTREPNRTEALHLVMRDIAEKIRRRAGVRPVVLLSSPNSSLLIGSFGDFRTIGTLYWENAEGLEAAARMFAAQSDEEALRLMQERGVTHVALINWENFIEPYVRIVMPEGGDAAVWNSFGIKALFRRTIPVWCRPIPYPRYPMLDALGLDILLLEVVPEQTLDEALFHLALYHRFERRPDEAESVLRELLRRRPEANRARLELAAVLLDKRRTSEAMDEILEGLRTVEGPMREEILVAFARQLVSMQEGSRAVALLQAFPFAIDAERPEGAHRVNLLAWILATSADDALRNPERSLALLDEIERAGAARHVPWGDTRAAALAALGRFDEAVAVLQRHIEGLDPTRHAPQIFEILRRRLELYRAGKPWLEPYLPAPASPAPPAPVGPSSP